MSKVPQTTTVSAPDLVALRELLREWQPATGPTGFEGLVAHALAWFTGYTFRLARSGSQFGRDAATPKAPFAIAMEAKRYRDSVPLQELVGKSTLASFALADGIDVWVLAATVEISEPTERQLENILDQNGISLLTLDWTDAGLPPLAVLLAAVRPEVVSWAKPYLEPTKLTALATGLDRVADDPTFDAHLVELKDKLSPGILGLDAFRRKGGEWFEQTFGSRRLAQRQYSQFLAPLEAQTLNADRPNVQKAIADAVRAAKSDEEGDTFVAVLGGEGSGKSWAVTNWWLASNPRPILMLSAGRIANQLSPGDEPFEMLARLAAHQFGSRDEAAIARWRRRLERWSQGENSRERFAVVIDGLNETSGKEWASLLRDLMPAVRDVGGVLVATCREGYWDREIAPRLSTYITPMRVDVGNYNDSEFADVMHKNGVDPANLPPRLNSFMRNPRICALALTMLPQLSGIEDLSVDRLLLEYWRARLQERDDLLAHNDIDFRNLLIRHAREYRERPGTDFSRDEWRTRSGAAQRQDGREIANDLSDIEEGRFFDTSMKTYQFSKDALHFALGLLVADELGTATQDKGADLDEALAEIIDPIRGFDTLADIMLAAIAVATLDSDYPSTAIAVLANAWISLQNLMEDATDALLPYIAARPDPFLDAYERRNTERDDGRFLQLLIYSASQQTAVGDALDARFERWLGTWSRTLPGGGGGSDQARRQAQHIQSIDEKLASLDDAERRWFGELCCEHPRSTDLKMAAALRLFGQPQAPFARGVLAFAFAFKVAGHYFWPYEEFAWALRLNRKDPDKLACAVREALAPFSKRESSELGRQVAAYALRLLGTLEGEVEAEVLSPRSASSFGRDDEFDPLDPAMECSENSDTVISRLAAIEPEVLWNQMSTTSEDYDLDSHLILLARLNPDAIKGLLDRIASTVATRTGMPLRQLAWRLPWLTPILSEGTIAAVRQRIAEAVDDPTIMPVDDAEWMIGKMVECVLPSLDGCGQLDLLQSLPPDAPYFLRYSAVARPLNSDVAARRLAAVIDGNPRILERTLLFLSSTTTEVTDALRELVIKCLKSEEPRVVAAAAEIARGCVDSDLDNAVLDLDLPADNHRSWLGPAIRAAISCAIARRQRVDLVDTIPVEHLDWVAVRLPAAQERLADTIEDMVGFLTRPIASDDPADATVVLEVEDDLALSRFNLEDRGEEFDDPGEKLKLAFSDTTGARFARRRRLLGQQLDQFLDSLASADALTLARSPYTSGLKEVACHYGDRYAGWLRSILSVSDERSLSQIKNIGLTLAQSYAEFDPELSARTLALLWEVNSCVTVIVGTARLPISYLALFRAASSDEIDGLRAAAFKEALNDSEIERLVLAAEAVSAGDWLAAFVDECLDSDAPADHALAITIASLRPMNDHSDKILEREWHQGFLGESARVGKSRYQSAVHADYWFGRAAEAEKPQESWCFLELGIAAADRRQLLNPPYSAYPELRLVGADLAHRLEKAVDRATKNAEKTLYGSRRPANFIKDLTR